MIKCHQCDEEMFPATINTELPASIPVTINTRKEHVIFSDVKTELLCYVCPKCGRVELYAKDPQKIRKNLMG